MRMLSASARTSLTEEINRYHENLLDQDGGSAQDYLAGRGIRPPMWDRFKLGFDGERLTIPYLTPAGPWLVKRRCIQHDKCEGHPKYKNTEGAELHLYNAPVLIDSDLVVVTEGELDAVTVEQAGVNAVAVPGATQWKANRHWRFCFDSVSEVIVVGDGDKPGEESAKAISDSLRSTFNDIEVRTVILPAGMDSNSYAQAEGDMALLELLEVI